MEGLELKAEEEQQHQEGHARRKGKNDENSQREAYQSLSRWRGPWISLEGRLRVLLLLLLFFPKKVSSTLALTK